MRSFPYRCTSRKGCRCISETGAKGPRKSLSAVSPRDVGKVRGLVRGDVAEEDHRCEKCGELMTLELGRLQRSTERNSTYDTCTCDGLPYPHRRTTRGCEYGTPLDEQDYEDFKAALIRAIRTRR